jgi:hypothetical protein
MEPRQRRRIASSLEITGPDLTSIAVGTPARAEFESEFKVTMADSLGELVEPSDIVIEDIRSGSGGAGRRVLRRLQNAGITVDFSILADEEAASAAQSAAATLQASDTTFTLSVGGEVVIVTPSTAMAPPSEPVVADLDCEGNWRCDTDSCILTFIRTQAQSGSGASCPDEPSCQCMEPEDAEPSGHDDGLHVGIIVVVVVAGAAALSAAYCCYSRRATSTSGKTPAHSPPVVKGGWDSKARRQQQQFALGSTVQIWSKSSQTWCNGRVAKVIPGGDAVDVAYTVGKRDTKERRKTVRIDSGNIRFSQKRGGPFP